MDEQNFDPRKNVLQGILKGARAGQADQLKQRYRSTPMPNLEANAKQPVPGVEVPEGEQPAEGQPQQGQGGEQDLQAMLEQMLSQNQG